MKLKRLKKVVITGVNGFVGKHLARELHNAGYTVVGIGRTKDLGTDLQELVDIYLNVDLSKEWPSIGRVDAIVHLAGLATVWESFEKPQEYISVNSAMMTNMCEFYLKEKVMPRILVVSSGAVYEPTQPMPLKEEALLTFNSPYSVSKAVIEHQATYYSKRGLECVVVRPFNHIGPGQTRGFLIPDVIAQLKFSNKLTVGNIDTRRDYTDVRDIVRAYRLLIEARSLNYSTYNACSGTSRSGKEMISLLEELMGKKEVKILVDTSKVRPTDSPDIYGDTTKIYEDTGWKPEIPLRQTLLDCIAATSS